RPRARVPVLHAPRHDREPALTAPRRLLEPPRVPDPGRAREARRAPARDVGRATRDVVAPERAGRRALARPGPRPRDLRDRGAGPHGHAARPEGPRRGVLSPRRAGGRGGGPALPERPRGPGLPALERRGPPGGLPRAGGRRDRRARRSRAGAAARARDPL